MQIVGEIDDAVSPGAVAQLLHRIVALLQAAEAARGHIQERRKRGKGDAALAVDRIEVFGSSS